MVLVRILTVQGASRVLSQRRYCNNNLPAASPWKAILDDKSKHDEGLKQRVMEGRDVRNEMYDIANEELEREANRFSGTQEEKLQQLQARRERLQYFTDMKLAAYMFVYNVKKWLIYYCFFMLCAWAIYITSFMQSMDKSIAAY